AFALGAGGKTAIANQNANETGVLVINYTGNTSMRPQDLFYSQLQTVALTNAIAGTTKFTLSFNGAVTAPITYGTNIAATVKSQLDGLSTIGAIRASTTVTQVGSTFYVGFNNFLGGLELPTLQAAVTSAPGTGVPAISTTDISGASNAGPIVITSRNHGLTTGQQVSVAGVVGNAAANGTF